MFWLVEDRLFVLPLAYPGESLAANNRERAATRVASRDHPRLTHPMTVLCVWSPDAGRAISRRRIRATKATIADARGHACLRDFGRVRTLGRAIRDRRSACCGAVGGRDQLGWRRQQAQDRRLRRHPGAVSGVSSNPFHVYRTDLSVQIQYLTGGFNVNWWQATNVAG